MVTYSEFLEAELMVRASIGNVVDASFSVSGRISISILQRIQDAVVGLIQKAAKAADEAISGAQNEVRRAEVVFDIAVRNLQNAQASVRNARNEVNKIRNKIRSLRMACVDTGHVDLVRVLCMCTLCIYNAVYMHACTNGEHLHFW